LRCAVLRAVQAADRAARHRVLERMGKLALEQSKRRALRQWTGLLRRNRSDAYKCVALRTAHTLRRKRILFADWRNLSTTGPKHASPLSRSC
jgi:hypothetical protein